jgi:hypothetical protein
MKRHFDGRGHGILDFFEMVKRYSGDFRSLAVLRQFAPSRYVVVPDCEIHIKKDRSDQSYCLLSWGSADRRAEFNVTDRRRAALLRLYRSGDTKWKIREDCREVVFSRMGCIVENRGNDFLATTTVAE